MTIPQLRKAFDHVQIIAKDIAAGSINDTSVSQFMQEWRKTFGKSLREKEAREYLEHMKQMNPSGKKRTISKATRKSHQRGGGGPIGGAPIDNQTQPGVYGEYGKFLPYVTGGFGVGVPTPSQLRPAIPDPSMEISNDVGNGAILKGGSRSRRGSRKQHSKRKHKNNTRRQMKGGSNFVLSTVPTSVIQDMKIAWRGQPQEMSPSPVDMGHRLRMP